MDTQKFIKMNILYILNIHFTLIFFRCWYYRCVTDIYLMVAMREKYLFNGGCCEDDDDSCWLFGLVSLV